MLTPGQSSSGYLAWVPSSPQNPLPFPTLQHINATNLTIAPDPQHETLQFGHPGSLFVAVVPKMFDTIPLATVQFTGGCILYESEPPDFFDDATLLQCNLLNSSFTARFDYLNGAQSVTVVANDPAVPAHVTPVACVTGPVNDQEALNETVSYDSDYKNTSCSTLNIEGQQCLFDAGVVQTLSYQGVFQAFNDVLQGSIGLVNGANQGTSNADNPKRNGVAELSVKSNVWATVLMDTTELGFIDNWCIGTCELSNLQTYPFMSVAKDVQGLSGPYPIGSRGHLDQALETLFQNITISLLSEQYLQ